MNTKKDAEKRLGLYPEYLMHCAHVIEAIAFVYKLVD